VTKDDGKKTRKTQDEFVGGSEQESDGFSNFHEEPDGDFASDHKSKGACTIKAAWYGAWGGMFLFAGMFALCLWLYSGFQVMDVSSKEIEQIIRNDFRNHIIIFQIKILGAYLAVGAVLGAFFGLVGGGFHKKDKRKRKITCFVSGFLGTFTAHIIIYLYALGQMPGLYAKWFHETGFPLASIQGLATTILVPPVTGTLIVLLFLSTLATIFGRLHKWGKPILVILVIVGAVTCFCVQKFQKLPELVKDSTRPNILILAADSIRPNRLGLYTHSKQTSPNIEKLAKDGFYFSNAYCTLARTFPSWASILSGQDPQTHGIRSMFPDPKDTNLEGSIAWALKENGYRTAVFADYAGDIFPRMQAGFDFVNAPDFDFTTLIDTNSLKLHFLLLPYLDNRWARKVFPIINAFEDNCDPAYLSDNVISYIDSAQDKPFFAVAFYSPTHFPFSSRYPYYKKFVSRKYNGRYKYRKPVELTVKDISDEDVEHIRGLFDGGIFAFDVEVGRIVKALKDRNALDNTIIIVTSDHGENLYEKLDDIGHGDHFRGNNTLLVPMVFHWPKQIAGPIGKRTKSGVINSLVSHVDIVPTLYSALGITPKHRVDGLDLTKLITGQTHKARDMIFAESGLWLTHTSVDYLKSRRIDYPEITATGKYDPVTKRIYIDPQYTDITNIAKHRMGFDGRYKLVQMPTSEGIKYECYDLKKDPNETENLIDSIYPYVACAKIKNRLLEWLDLAPQVDVLNGFALPSE